MCEDHRLPDEALRAMIRRASERIRKRFDPLTLHLVGATVCLATATRLVQLRKSQLQAQS